MPSVKLSLLTACLCCALARGFVPINGGRLTHQTAAVRRSRAPAAALRMSEGAPAALKVDEDAPASLEMSEAAPAALEIPPAAPLVSEDAPAESEVAPADLKLSEDAPAAALEVSADPVADLSEASPATAVEMSEAAPAEVQMSADAPVADLKASEDAPADLKISEDAPAEVQMSEAAPAALEISEDAPAEVHMTEAAPAEVHMSEAAPAEVQMSEDAPVNGYEKAQRSVFDTEGVLDTIFEKNRLWAASQDPKLFEKIANAQAPKFLYIGCSDSRVPAENMLGMNLGELFVHRNVANLCINTDYSLMSVLKFSIEALGITDIIVCGHYGCGGVKAAMQNQDHGLLEHWLHSIRNVQRLHAAELAEIPDENIRHQRLIELNVQEQCMNLFANPIVQRMQALESKPRIHGLVYDVATGLIKDVKVDFEAEFKKHSSVYRLYDSEHYESSEAAPAKAAEDIPVNTANMTPRIEPHDYVVEGAKVPGRTWAERARAAKEAFFSFR